MILNTISINNIYTGEESVKVNSHLFLEFMANPWSTKDHMNNLVFSLGDTVDYSILGNKSAGIDCTRSINPSYLLACHRTQQSINETNRC